MNTWSMEQSARIKEAVREGLFSEKWLIEVLRYQKPTVRKVVLKQNKLDSYFEPNMTNEDIVGYTTTIPFMYLIPLLQLTYSVR